MLSIVSNDYYSSTYNGSLIPSDNLSSYLYLSSKFVEIYWNCSFSDLEDNLSYSPDFVDTIKQAVCIQGELLFNYSQNMNVDSIKLGDFSVSKSSTEISSLISPVVAFLLDGLNLVFKGVDVLC